MIYPYNGILFRHKNKIWMQKIYMDAKIQMNFERSQLKR